MSKQSIQERKNELNTDRQMEQKLFDKVWKDVYTIFNKAGFHGVDIGDRFIKVSDTHGDFKIDIKVEVRKV